MSTMDVNTQIYKLQQNLFKIAVSCDNCLCYELSDNMRRCEECECKMCRSCSKLDDNRRICKFCYECKHERDELFDDYSSKQLHFFQSELEKLAFLCERCCNYAPDEWKNDCSKCHQRVCHSCTKRQKDESTGEYITTCHKCIETYNSN